MPLDEISPWSLSTQAMSLKGKHKKVLKINNMFYFLKDPGDKALYDHESTIPNSKLLFHS